MGWFKTFHSVSDASGAVCRSELDAMIAAGKFGAAFPKDWCVAYDPYSRNINAGAANAPTPVTFYKVGNNVPSDSNIKLDGSVVNGGKSGSIKVGNAGVYLVAARIQMTAKDTDTGFIVQVGSDTETAGYLNRFVIPKGAMQGQLTSVFNVAAGSTLRLGLTSTSPITTSQSPNGNGNNAISVAISMAVVRIA